MRQILLSVFLPYFEQLPPCLGSGLSHFRDHVSYPTPQVTLQLSDLVQLLKLPSTKIIQKNYNYCKCFKNNFFIAFEEKTSDRPVC